MRQRTKLSTTFVPPEVGYEVGNQVRALVPGAAPGQSFADRVIRWQRAHGRHALPWQGTRDPYRIWLSEIMLQQTQVAAVIAYYERFLAQLPTVASLAAAADDEVMALWSGLGYYSRARNLHACARVITRDFDGNFPRDPETLASLPGIGRSTAAAIAAFAFGTRAAILDGNVKRVFARHWAVEGWPGQPRVAKQLWALAEQHLPADAKDNIERYTQGLMDLGATLCTRGKPQCEACPIAETCVAKLQERTADFPTPKPRREVPVRSAQMLVALHAGQVLLEKRPPSGIWGGLWSLPEFSTLAALEHWLATHHARDGETPPLHTLDERKHSFTHYTLLFTPHVVQVQRKSFRVEEAGRIWLDLDEAGSAALPAPLKKLLLDLRR
jgi:A/G-specific adenine glycosylase